MDEVIAERLEDVVDVLDDHRVLLAILARTEQPVRRGSVAPRVAEPLRRTRERGRLDEPTAAAHEELGRGADEHRTRHRVRLGAANA